MILPTDTTSDETTVTAVSAWVDTQSYSSPTYRLGGGHLKPYTNYARLRTMAPIADREGVPDDLIGYSVLASDDDGVVYEGSVTGHRRLITNRGACLELRCTPAETVD